ncbi:MAG: hypothetical protein ACJ741_00965, partial [Pyrinomonadaceae bacterium]
AGDARWLPAADSLLKVLTLSRDTCRHCACSPKASGGKLMITFRKHTIVSTDCHVSLLRMSPRRGCIGIRFAALFILAFVASATAFATPRHGKHVRRHIAAEPSTRAHAEKTEPDAKVPIRYTRLDLPEGPGIIADIGEFAFDLNEVGQSFLEREFFEHFASDVVGLDDSSGSESRTALKVTMLPQEKNQREGDFIFGKVKGHIIVVVEKRRVIVACMFKKAQNQPPQIAVARALAERLTAG